MPYSSGKSPKRKAALIGLIAIVAVVGGVIGWQRQKSGHAEAGKLDAFAQCLKDQGAMFYGAFWCPHCQNQKRMFGKSAKLLPYTECSTPDGKAQLEVCKAKNVSGYPTWEFRDGSREVGEVSLERLAEKTGCALPQ